MQEVGEKKVTYCTHKYTSALEWKFLKEKKKNPHRNELCRQSFLPLPSKGELSVTLYKVCFHPNDSTRTNISKILLLYWQGNKHIHQQPGSMEVVLAHGRGVGI